MSYTSNMIIEGSTARVSLANGQQFTIPEQFQNKFFVLLKWYISITTDATAGNRKFELLLTINSEDKSTSGSQSYVLGAQVPPSSNVRIYGGINAAHDNVGILDNAGAMLYFTQRIDAINLRESDVIKPDFLETVGAGDTIAHTLEFEIVPRTKEITENIIAGGIS